MPTVFDNVIIWKYEKFANYFKMWLYGTMKTKKRIFSSIFFIILGVFSASVNIIAYGNSGGSGGSGPGCYGCECFGTCEETTSGTSTTD